MLERTLIHKEDEICDILYPLLIFVTTGRDLINKKIVLSDETLPVSKQDRLLYYRSKINCLDNSEQRNPNIHETKQLTLLKEDVILKSILKDMKNLIYSGPKQDNIQKYWIIEYFYSLLKRDKILHSINLSQIITMICKIIETVDEFKIVKLCFDYIYLAFRYCYPVIYLHYVCYYSIYIVLCITQLCSFYLYVCLS